MKSQIAVEYVILTAFSLFLLSIGIAIFLNQQPQLKSSFCSSSIDSLTDKTTGLISVISLSEINSKQSFSTGGLNCLEKIGLINDSVYSYLYFNTSFFEKFYPINNTLTCDNCVVDNSLHSACGAPSATCYSFNYDEFSPIAHISVQKNSSSIIVSIK